MRSYQIKNIMESWANEAGNVKDAYWNEIDPRTGELIQP